MIDEALPRFTLSESSNTIKHHSPVYLSRPHSDPEPFYTLQHADPSTSNSRNCYAAGLVDAFNADVLYGEVLIQPEWTQPSVSQEEIRRNGGVPPPPEPFMPRGFTVQLYNPDQQIHVSQKSTAVLGSARWEFSMPQDVFRQPSASALDRSQDDPTAELTTLKLNFAWKRESNFKKDLTCYMTGKNTDITHKKKSKEPDMAIAQFKGLKDMTIYEPSLYRLEMEDPKGLEVVLILAAAVIKDVYFAKDLGSTFNISGARANSGPRRDSSASAHSQHASPPPQPARPLPGAGAAAGGLYASAPNKLQRPHASSLPNRDRLDTPGQPPPGVQQRPTDPRPPPADPRTAWEIEAETTRLRKQAEAEKRRLQKEEERARRERERQAEEESRRLKKMLEREEKEKQRRQREEQERVDRETARLRKMYGVGAQQVPNTSSGGPPMMSGANGRPPPNSAPLQQRPFIPRQPPRPSHSPAPPSGYAPQPQMQAPMNWTPHQGYAAQFGAGPSQSSSNLAPPGQSSTPNQKPRRSFLNLRGGAEEADRMRKRSSVF